MRQYTVKVFGILLITILLSLCWASSTRGSITASAIVNYKYNLWVGEDIIDAILNFNGKINDNASAYISVEYQSNSTVPTSGTAYFTYTLEPKLGTFTVGCFNESLGNLNLLGNSIDYLKSNFGFKLERPITNGLSMRIGCYPHEQRNLTNQNVYTIGFSYTDDDYRASLNLARFENSTRPVDYAANFLYMPNRLLKVYAHYGDKIDGSIDGVIGAALSIPPSIPSFIITAEYNAAKPDLWGVGLNYTIDKNIILSYYRTTSSSNYNEFRLTISL